MQGLLLCAMLGWLAAPLCYAMMRYTLLGTQAAKAAEARAAEERKELARRAAELAKAEEAAASAAQKVSAREASLGQRERELQACQV